MVLVTREVETMDQPHKSPPSSAHDKGSTFSVAEYKADLAKVIAHAAATGYAAVVDEDGQLQAVITIPIVDLPTLDY